ncbi:hypothetical protein ACFLTS_02555 [Chloroflexota bacterium]
MGAGQPGRDSEFIKERRIGLYSVVFSVDNVDIARIKAQEMGIRVKRTLEFNHGQQKQYFQGRFKKFKQILLDPGHTAGVRVTLGQIEPK